MLKPYVRVHITRRSTYMYMYKQNNIQRNIMHCSLGPTARNTIYPCDYQCFSPNCYVRWQPIENQPYQCRTTAVIPLNFSTSIFFLIYRRQPQTVTRLLAMHLQRIRQCIHEENKQGNINAKVRHVKHNASFITHIETEHKVRGNMALIGIQVSPRSGPYSNPLTMQIMQFPSTCFGWQRFKGLNSTTAQRQTVDA